MNGNGFHRALSVLALCAASFAASAQQSGYSLTLVGTTYPDDPSRQFSVSDISDRGDLTGSRGLPNGDQVAFVWRNGVFRDLNSRISAQSASASAINDGLDIALVAENAPPLQNRAYILRGTGQLITIVPPQGRVLRTVGDINDRRQALVTTADGAGRLATALWYGGQYSHLDPLPGSTSTSVRRLNDFGVVVGTATSLATDTAVLWQKGTVMPLPKPQGATRVSGIDISDDGTVVMDATFPAAPAHTSVVLWKEGQLTVLKSLPGKPWANSMDISNRNVVVGRSFADPASTSGMTATLWRAGVPTDLNTRVLGADPLKSFVHLQWALHISDWGYIVARGVDARFTDGRVGIYLLTPH